MSIYRSQNTNENGHTNVEKTYDMVLKVHSIVSKFPTAVDKQNEYQMFQMNALDDPCYISRRSHSSSHSK